MNLKKAGSICTAGFFISFLNRVRQQSQSVWIIKFENKARKNLKTQYTKVFEELRFLQ